ncbi:MAG: outer membrane lipoprotein carrier protein LolA [Pseudomonadota bacterium]
MSKARVLLAGVSWLSCLVLAAAMVHAAPAPPAAPAAPAAAAPAPRSPSPAPQPGRPGLSAAQLQALAAAQAEAAALAGRIQARYQQINTLAAHYLRKSFFVAAGSDGERTVEGSGVMLWAKPTSLRLQQETPRQELILTQHGSVWWVRPQRGRADVYPLDRFTSGLRSLLDALGGLARVDESFTVEPAEEDDHLADSDALTLVLKPKENRADLKRLVLWFSPGELVLTGFKIINLIGDITEYRFEQVQVNPPLDAKAFSYQAPPDYRVTDHRPQPMNSQSQ